MEHIKIAAAMIKYGGSFVESLGRLLQQADDENVEKIKATWPEYWERYSKLAVKREEPE